MKKRGEQRNRSVRTFGDQAIGLIGERARTVKISRAGVDTQCDDLSTVRKQRGYGDKRQIPSRNLSCIEAFGWLGPEPNDSSFYAQHRADAGASGQLLRAGHLPVVDKNSRQSEVVSTQEMSAGERVDAAAKEHNGSSQGVLIRLH
jgi:hypothetical protein